MGSSVSSVSSGTALSAQQLAVPTTFITTTRSGSISSSANGKVQSLSGATASTSSPITNLTQLISTATATSSKSTIKASKTSNSLSAASQLTSTYPITTSLPPVNQQTGVRTITNTGTPSIDTGIYSIVTQDGGLCRMSVTNTSPQTPGTYIAATTLMNLDTTLANFDRRASGTQFTITPIQTGTGTPAGGIPFGTTGVPASDIPVCATATPSGVFEPATTGKSQSSAMSVDNSNRGLSPGQKAGIAVGVVIAVVLLILAAGTYMWKKGRWSQATQAQSNIWGPGDAVGGTNAGGMTEGERIASGQGLRDVLYSNRASGYR